MGLKLISLPYWIVLSNIDGFNCVTLELLLKQTAAGTVYYETLINSKILTGNVRGGVGNENTLLRFGIYVSQWDRVTFVYHYQGMCPEADLRSSLDSAERQSLKDFLSYRYRDPSKVLRSVSRDFADLLNSDNPKERADGVSKFLSIIEGVTDSGKDALVKTAPIREATERVVRLELGKGGGKEFGVYKGGSDNLSRLDVSATYAKAKSTMQVLTGLLTGILPSQKWLTHTQPKLRKIVKNGPSKVQRNEPSLPPLNQQSSNAKSHTSSSFPQHLQQQQQQQQQPPLPPPPLPPLILGQSTEQVHNDIDSILNLSMPLNSAAVVSNKKKRKTRKTFTYEEAQHILVRHEKQVNATVIAVEAILTAGKGINNTSTKVSKWLGVLARFGGMSKRLQKFFNNINIMPSHKTNRSEATVLLKESKLNGLELFKTMGDDGYVFGMADNLNVKMQGKHNLPNVTTGAIITTFPSITHQYMRCKNPEGLALFPQGFGNIGRSVDFKYLRAMIEKYKESVLTVPTWERKYTDVDFFRKELILPCAHEVSLFDWYCAESIDGNYGTRATVDKMLEELTEKFPPGTRCMIVSDLALGQHLQAFHSKGKHMNIQEIYGVFHGDKNYLEVSSLSFSDGNMWAIVSAYVFSEKKSIKQAKQAGYRMVPNEDYDFDDDSSSDSDDDAFRPRLGDFIAELEQLENSEADPSVDQLWNKMNEILALEIDTSSNQSQVAVIAALRKRLNDLITSCHLIIIIIITGNFLK